MNEPVTSDPEAILRDTAWSDLEHGQGAAVETHEVLRGLLSGDPATAAAAVWHVEQVVNHQGTMFSAMPPVVRYVAAILADPRTMIEGTFRRDDPPRILRAALLEWLATVAEDVSDASREAARRYGSDPDELPADAVVRSLRPTVLAAVEPHLSDPEPSVREAALITTAMLLDDGDEIDRRMLFPGLGGIATASLSRRRRADATELLATHGRLPEEVPPF